MGDHSKIEWTDTTWNPVRGCTLVSPGCKNCYAMKIAHRFSGPGQTYESLTARGKNGPVWNGAIKLVLSKLVDPLRWRKPRRVFVNSMSDLFHPEVPDWFIRFVFSVMASAPDHTFQVLTKRPERMADFVSSLEWRFGWFIFGKHMVFQFCFEEDEVKGGVHIDEKKPGWIPPNVWLGTSVEDQQRADERIPDLLRTPAAVRFLSCEPLLGPISFDLDHPRLNETKLGTFSELENGIDWVIVGGESGPGARPMHPDWARAIRDQCAEAGVPFFFKQWGAWAPENQIAREEWEAGGYHYEDYFDAGFDMLRIGKRRAGRLLDGREWNEYPAERPQ